MTYHIYLCHSTSDGSLYICHTTYDISYYVKRHRIYGQPHICAIPQPSVWNEQPIDKITSISASPLVSQKSLFVFGTGRLKKEIAKEYHPSGKLSCQKRKEITQQDHFVKREIFCKKMLIWEIFCKKIFICAGSAVSVSSACSLAAELFSFLVFF